MSPLGTLISFVVLSVFPNIGEYNDDVRHSFLSHHFAVNLRTQTGLCECAKFTKFFIQVPSTHQDVLDLYDSFHKNMLNFKMEMSPNYTKT